MPEISILVKATDKASGIIRGMGQKIKGSVNNLIKLPHLLAAGAIAFAIKDVVKAYGVQEEGIAKLNAALRASGQFTQAASDALVRHAGALQKSTTFGDEQIIAAQAMLATFKLSEEQIKKIIPLTLDMAAATGTDAVRASILMGKAAVGVTGELSRYGIIVDKTDLKNRGLSAVLDEVRLNFGGTAEAITKTGVGPLKQFGNLVGDVKEKLGEALMPTLTEIIKVVQENLPEIQSLLVNTVKIVGALAESVVKIYKFTANLVSISKDAAAATASEQENLQALQEVIEEGGASRDKAISIMKRYQVINSEIIKSTQEGRDVDKETLEGWKKMRAAIAAEVALLETKKDAVKRATGAVSKATKEQFDARQKVVEDIKKMTMETTAFELEQAETKAEKIRIDTMDEALAAEWLQERKREILEKAAEEKRERQEAEVEEFHAHLEEMQEVEAATLDERLEKLDEFYGDAKKKYAKDKEATLKLDETYEKAKAKLRIDATKEKAKMEIEAAKDTLGTLKATLGEAAGLESMGKEERKGIAVASAMISQALSLVKVWESAAGFGPFAAIMAAAQTAIVLAKTGAQISKIQAMGAGGIITEPTLVLAGERGPEKFTPLEEGGVPMGDNGGGGRGITINMQILDIEGLSPQRKQEWAEALQPYLQLEQTGRGGA